MYGKFFASTFTGSMFGAGCEVFAVWSYVIAHAVDSTVELNPAMLAAILGADEERISNAIAYLCNTDPKSRNPEEGGRRLVHESAYQYRVVSHARYRAIRNDEDRRTYNREAQRKSRAKHHRDVAVKRAVNDGQSLSAMSAHTETESEPEAETEAERRDQTPLPPASGGHVSRPDALEARSGSGGVAPLFAPAPASKPTPGQRAYRRRPDHLTSVWQSATAAERAAVDEVIAYWRETMRSEAGGDVETRVTVLWRLRDPVEPATVEKIKQAIVGCSKTPHNMGNNEKRTLYNQLELICRNGANLNRFAANASPPPKPVRRCLPPGCGKPLGTSDIMGMHPACYEALPIMSTPPARTDNS